MPFPLDQRLRRNAQCPCCGNLTLANRATFEVCPVCFWEDDGQDDGDAQVIRGGPNGSLSLTEARRRYAECGACDPRLLSHVRPPLPEEIQSDRFGMEGAAFRGADNQGGGAGMPLPRTGLVCPACQEPVGIIENKLAKILVFLCPACGPRWSDDEPGAAKQ
jgi:hypothetical protein